MWLGIGADVVTFGTIGAATAKLFTGITTGTRIAEFGHKITSASQAMTIFHKASKPLADGASILVTGFKVFEEIKHQNNLKALPANLLLMINGSEEFDETNMLLMSVTTGYWTKSKMVYCSPEEFQEMVQEQILNNLADQCENPEMLSKVSNFIKHDQTLLQLLKYLGVNLTIPESVKFLHELIINEKNMDVKFDLAEKLVILGDLEFSFEILSSLKMEELSTILKFLFNLDILQKNNFKEIRSYLNCDKDYFKLLSFEKDKAGEVLEALYDVFALTFNQNLMKIDGEVKSVQVGTHKFSIGLLMKLSKEERRYMILYLIHLNEEAEQEFQTMRENFKDDEKLMKIIGSGKENCAITEELLRCN